MCISGCKGNFYTGNGQRFSYIAGANEQETNLDQIIATTNPFVNSDYLRLYPGMTKDNLKTNGIMRVPGENYVFVDQAHPIVEMYVVVTLYVVKNTPYTPLVAQDARKPRPTSIGSRKRVFDRQQVGTRVHPCLLCIRSHTPRFRRWYKVSKAVTDRCLSELGEELDGNLP